MNSKRYLLLLFLLCIAVSSLAPTTPRGKVRLLELVVVPTINLQFSFSYNARTTLSDLTSEASLSDQIARVRRDVKQSPNHARPLIQLGWLLNENSETNEAKRCFQQAVTIAEGHVAARPNDGLAHVDWGDACYELEKKELAERAYRTATQVSSNEWRCWVALGQFLDRQTRSILYPTNLTGLLMSSSPEIARPTPDKMERAIKSKTEAAFCFDRAVSLSPKEVDVYLLRAWHKCGDEANDYLLRYYRNELRLDRKALGALIGMGLAKSAIPDLQKSATLQPQVCQLVGLAAWFELITIAMTPLTGGTAPTQFSDLPESSQRLIRSAIAQLTELSNGNDTKRTALALEYLAAIRVMTGEGLDLVPAELRRAIALDPNRERVWDLLLGSMLESASPEEIAAVCEDRLKHKKSARNHLIFAKALFRRGSIEKAAGEARAAIKLETNNVPAHLMLCAALLRQDKGESGKMELRSAFKKADELVEQSRNAPEGGDWWLVHGLNVAIGSAIDGEAEIANSWLDACQKEFPDDERIKEIRSALP